MFYSRFVYLCIYQTGQDVEYFALPAIAAYGICTSNHQIIRTVPSRFGHFIESKPLANCNAKGKHYVTAMIFFGGKRRHYDTILMKRSAEKVFFWRFRINEHISFDTQTHIHRCDLDIRMEEQQKCYLKSKPSIYRWSIEAIQLLAHTHTRICLPKFVAQRRSEIPPTLSMLSSSKWAFDTNSHSYRTKFVVTKAMHQRRTSTIATFQMLDGLFENANNYDLRCKLFRVVENHKQQRYVSEWKNGCYCKCIRLRPLAIYALVTHYLWVEHFFFIKLHLKKQTFPSKQKGECTSTLHLNCSKRIHTRTQWTTKKESFQLMELQFHSVAHVCWYSTLYPALQLHILQKFFGKTKICTFLFFRRPVRVVAIVSFDGWERAANRKLFALHVLRAVAVVLLFSCVFVQRTEFSQRNKTLGFFPC